MKTKKPNESFSRRRQIYAIFLSLFAFLCGAGNLSGFAADNDETVESPEPILISRKDSVAALTAAPKTWDGGLPKERSGVFAPGSAVVVFITNIDLMPGEDHGAFRAFAEDAGGNQYRLTVESIQPLRAHEWIFGLTLRIRDAAGYNGQPPAGELLIRVGWRGNTSNRVLLNTGIIRGKRTNLTGLVPTPAPLAPPAPTQLRASTWADRKRFMEQAAFGPTQALDFRLRQLGLRRWIEEQFNVPYPTIPYPNHPLKHPDSNIYCGGPYNPNDPESDLCHRNWGNHRNVNWLHLETLYGEDQLRRRVSWALHQIWVVSGFNAPQQRYLQEYIEILDRNAFGNYRDLMKQMTLSPAMGEFLDMVRSTRQNPNENYPRELLQLFTIGLYELNQDGTLVLDLQGNRIPTYDQDKIDQFTKVFTGWTHCNSGNNPACPNAVVGTVNFIDPMHVLFPNNHDLTTKSLLNYPGAPNQTIAACSNCTTDAARIAYANESLDKTLDNIFYHPNVAPFVSKLLIQHLVTSDPSPAYVGRVAAAFNNNGAGVRGDMKAVVRAILLDPEARGSRKTDPTYGKLREPLQLYSNFLRTFNVRAGYQSGNNTPATPPASCQNRSDGVFDWIPRESGQEIWYPPTVFNYFAPDYVVPETNILGPEFAIANSATSFARNNHILGFSFGGVWIQFPTAERPYPYTPCGTSIDVSEAAAQITADPSGNLLIEWLNTKMMHGTMSQAMKSKIHAAINFPGVDAASRARQAIFLIGSSSQYQIQR